MVDNAYQDKTSWVKKSITTTAKMGKFSSDRAIMNYAEVGKWRVTVLRTRR